MSEFDGIEGHDDWQAKLQELLTEARKAAKQDDDAREAMADRLVQFVIKSLPNDDMILALDEIAGNAAVDLWKRTAEERVQAITERNAQFAGLQKQFETLATKGKTEARALRLKRVREVADGLTNTVTQLRGFLDNLSEADDARLAKAIVEGIKTVKDLRELVETEGPMKPG
ncbi:MAG: hypothetical protein F4053_02875 [Proteobacteria bacterium]|nr:hypothetical protein [Pseudomonadota bacterium]